MLTCVGVLAIAALATLAVAALTTLALTTLALTTLAVAALATLAVTLPTSSSTCSAKHQQSQPPAAACQVVLLGLRKPTGIAAGALRLTGNRGGGATAHQQEELSAQKGRNKGSGMYAEVTPSTPFTKMRCSNTATAASSLECQALLAQPDSCLQLQSKGCKDAFTLSSHRTEDQVQHFRLWQQSKALALDAQHLTAGMQQQACRCHKTHAVRK